MGVSRGAAYVDADPATGQLHQTNEREYGDEGDDLGPRHVQATRTRARRRTANTSATRLSRRQPLWPLSLRELLRGISLGVYVYLRSGNRHGHTTDGRANHLRER
jgi:hypothetical protein